MPPSSILLVHIDALFRRTLMGEDVFYFEDPDSDICEDDKILSFKELSLVKRNLILISENSRAITGIEIPGERQNQK